MKVKLVKDEKFDAIGGTLGGFIDIPTKQDKFKPIKGKVILKKDDGTEEELTDVYVLNPSKRESMKVFEEEFSKFVKSIKTEEHPYDKSIPLEIIINVKMSKKRYNQVDVDNIAKCVLDIMKGELFDDDSQIQSLYINKQVQPAIELPPSLQKYTKSKEIPEGLAGLMFGIRRLDDKDSLLAGHEFYHFEEISDEEYNESQKNKE